MRNFLRVLIFQQYIKILIHFESTMIFFSNFFSNLIKILFFKMKKNTFDRKVKDTSKISELKTYFLALSDNFSKKNSENVKFEKKNRKI